MVLYIKKGGELVPRTARRKSETGIYHVIIRGVNRQPIFHYPNDYEKFLQILKDRQASDKFQIYAYCLMINHVHLLFHEGEKSMSCTFQQINTRYACWYNKKYNRCGHLFQGRYKSSPVNDDSYFLILLRYIHRNPVKAGLCSKVSDYPWNSYHEYIDSNTLVNIDYPLSVLAKRKDQAFAAFKELVNCESHYYDPTDDQLIITPYDSNRIPSESIETTPEDEAVSTFNRSVAEFSKLHDELQKNKVIQLHNEGYSIRKIASHLNVTPYYVRKTLEGSDTGVRKSHAVSVTPKLRFSKL